MRAILLVDHGSRKPAANALLDEMAERLRRRAPERLVAVAHMELAKPGVVAALDDCVARGARDIVVYPFFLAPGRHTTEDIPRLVEQAAARHPQVRLRVAAPLGAHEKLVDVILERVGDAEG